MAWAYDTAIVETDSSSTGTGTTFQHFEGRDRNATPEYRKLIAEGSVLPINYYKWSKSIVKQPKGYWPEPWPTSSTFWSHRGISVSYDESVAELTEQAVAQATAGLFEDVSEGDFNASVSAAEMPKTLRLVASTATRLGGAFRSLRRFDVPGAFRSLGAGSGPHYRSLVRRSNTARKQALRSGDVAKAGLQFAAGSWLEVKYGWKPLLMEVHSGSEALGRHFAKANSSDLRSYGSGKAKTSAVLAPNSNYKVVVNGERKVSVRYAVYSRVVSPGLRTAAGLGLTNPASVAWELLPFSFVVDWFLPVGNFIDSLSATAGTKFSSGAMMVKVEEGFDSSISSAYYGGQWYGTNWTYESSDKSFERTVLTSYPARTNILKAKKMTKALNTNKVVTSLALLVSAFT